MTKWLREFRIIPVLLIAAVSLLALKSIGLLFDGGYTLGQRLGGGALVVTTMPITPTTELRSPSTPLDITGASSRPKSWMQELFNYPEVTGSVAAKPKEPPKEAAVEGKDGKKDGAAAPAEPKPGAGTVVAVDQGGRPTSAAERALLERLQERRQELDARARELELRESIVKAAEKKLEAETASQKEGEAKDGGAQRKEAAEAARMKAVVTMYETMKPKEAAKIFDRLDSKVLFDVASQIKPQIMAAILAQMSADAAERLTVELAARGGNDKTANPSMLPKIDGKPDGG